MLEQKTVPPAATALVAYSEREAWEFVHFLSAHLASLETRAAILIPAQVAAVIALWTQFYTFEETLLHVLVWIAWAALILALVEAAWLVTPGRMHKTSIVGYGLQARAGVDREEVVREVCSIVQQRVRVLHTGLRISVGLTLVSLALVILAYALDKVFLHG